MSQIITLTTKTDGTFDNYFEDTIKIPPHSEVAFIKGLGLNVSYGSLEFLLVPKIDLDDRTKAIIRVVVDGVNVGLHWKNIYTAWDSLATSVVTEDEFFSGEYRWVLDPRKAGNILETIAKALNSKFEFYEIFPNGKISYDINNFGDPVIEQFGITSNYKSQTTDLGLWEGIENLNVWDGSANIVGVKEVEVTADNTFVYSSTQPSINGGGVSFQVTSTTQKGQVGLMFNSTAGDGHTGSGTIELDYGISINQNGAGTYNIIRNTNDREGFNGWTTGSDDDDWFTFIISRTSTPETFIAATEYTIYLLQGWKPDAAFDKLREFEDYIIDKFPLSAGFMPTFCIVDAESGFHLENIDCIKASRQDLESATFNTFQAEPADFNIGVGGTVFRNTHSFVLSNVGTMSNEAKEETREFFNRLGFNNWADITSGPNELQTTLGNTLPGNNTVISTFAPSAIRYQNIIFLKDNAPKNIDFQDPNEKEKTLSETFPYLQFHIETLDAITYEGNFQKGVKSRQQNTATKILNNIPKQGTVSLQDFLLDNPQQFTNYDYEVFNPLYVSLKNPAALNINQIKGRLVTTKNELIKLDTFDNTPRAMIMLHFRKELVQE